MRDRAVLLAHYGAARPGALEKTAFALEREVREAFPEWEVGSAFTGERMLARLRREGKGILSVQEALEQLRQGGCRQVLIQPTHLASGAEAEKLRQAALSFRAAFSGLALGEPLLANQEALPGLCAFLGQAFPQKPGRAVVFIGHGGSAAGEYQGLAACFRDRGRADIRVGLLKGEPGAESLGRGLWQAGFREALLVPLLFAAGVHVFRDIAGEGPESWKSRLESRGFAVQAVSVGLGEYPAVRQMYLERIRQLAGKKGGDGLADSDGGH